MITKQFITVKLDELHPYENNPRINDNAVSHVKASIEQCENLDPIEIDENGVILSGHTRLLALQQLGYAETEVVRISGLDEDQKRKYRILANKTNEIADWDFDKLAEELDGLDFDGFDFLFGDIDGFNFDAASGNADDNSEVVEDDYEEEPPAEPKAKLGDLWQLGSHRLICGDSTDVAVIDRLMDGVKADMVFTDPPYGINVVGKSGEIGGSTNRNGKKIKTKKYSPVINDDKEFDPSFICTYFGESKIFLWGANYFANKLYNSGKWLVWDKNRGEGTTFSDCELCWTNLDGIAVKKYKCTWDGMRREGESGKRFHPTQKPIKLCTDIIRDYSEEEDIIADIFGGSGSTLIACEQLNRKCYMVELDPKYVSVILQRYINFKGSDADVFLLKDGEKIPYSDVKS